MAASGAGRLAKLAAVAIGAALLAFQVVRTAAVEDREAHPKMAAGLGGRIPGSSLIKR